MTKSCSNNIPSFSNTTTTNTMSTTSNATSISSSAEAGIDPNDRYLLPLQSSGFYTTKTDGNKINWADTIDEEENKQLKQSQHHYSLHHTRDSDTKDFWSNKTDGSKDEFINFENVNDVVDDEYEDDYNLNYANYNNRYLNNNDNKINILNLTVSNNFKQHSENNNDNKVVNKTDSNDYKKPALLHDSNRCSSSSLIQPLRNDHASNVNNSRHADKYKQISSNQATDDGKVATNKLSSSEKNYFLEIGSDHARQSNFQVLTAVNNRGSKCEDYADHKIENKNSNDQFRSSSLQSSFDNGKKLEQIKSATLSASTKSMKKNDRESFQHESVISSSQNSQNNSGNVGYQTNTTTSTAANTKVFNKSSSCSSGNVNSSSIKLINDASNNGGKNMASVNHSKKAWGVDMNTEKDYTVKCSAEKKTSDNDIDIRNTAVNFVNSQLANPKNSKKIEIKLAETADSDKNLKDHQNVSKLKQPPVANAWHNRQKEMKLASNDQTAALKHQQNQQPLLNKWKDEDSVDFLFEGAVITNSNLYSQSSDKFKSTRSSHEKHLSTTTSVGLTTNNIATTSKPPALMDLHIARPPTSLLKESLLLSPEDFINDDDEDSNEVNGVWKDGGESFRMATKLFLLGQKSNQRPNSIENFKRSCYDYDENDYGARKSKGGNHGGSGRFGDSTRSGWNDSIPGKRGRGIARGSKGRSYDDLVKLISSNDGEGAERKSLSKKFDLK
ncbi:hypothetical protein HELRODRAFT_179516 [Helobdella robusta]|uniref:Uncharacterized protein n=1 Tax=Helobdella robusta TaxID=6412 RepID=T1FET9_HELRO|nr:hypothetical protein HELRODRAFT_179516 [Helobdella robusta]ESN95439.1 hypothetical protein HELRODRAFT_179516 [Helobdella robusta]